MKTEASPPDLQSAFDGWATWRALQRRPLNDESVALYESYWLSWGRHLAGIELRWNDAEPRHVAAFLAGGLRPVTQARYRRVLDEVYAHALRMEWIAQNPAAPQPGLPQHEQPQSAALHIDERDRFVAGLPAGSEPGPLRDRALLLLLVLEGLSVAETIALTLADVLPSPQQPERLSVRGERRNQTRELELDARTVAALQAWLRAAAGAMELARPHEQPLLTDLRSRRWTMPLGRHAAFRIVRAAIRDAVDAGHLRTMPAEHGPSLLRNTALLAWIEQGVAPTEVQRRAGLLRLDGLDRIVLRHAWGPVLERFQQQRQAERAAGLPEGPAG
ncbi:hypothetical protein [Caldimonas tepidiphila]|uniref:hypothetical protein n=1 Tax=Caldimonas tepidiphila TaxID=2315841 RepID=UPI0013008318|nr:hypothetical protein [Caldimonas tepidiphila]